MKYYIIAAFLFIMGKCADNENGNKMASLKDTKWKMLGFVNAQTGKITDAKPECDRCYTFTFDTDSTAFGYSLMNTIGLQLKPALRMWIETEAYDLQNGNIAVFYEAMESIESCSINNKVMKIFYSDNNAVKHYLLFKLIEPLEEVSE
jgi:hypothetical protein